ncbi:rCG30834, isoform CRA_c [Rattus norvegicus]|uniref:RCG30834, isoform CRA_c n=1 Tax=Rattus norvegicus TaxID=10116 RepID=A6ISC4_RAT|nr:rCG30834, isoform CRA_c [Rattus norvegicus]
MCMTMHIQNSWLFLLEFCYNLIQFYPKICGTIIGLAAYFIKVNSDLLQVSFDTPVYMGPSHLLSSNEPQEPLFNEDSTWQFLCIPHTHRKLSLSTTASYLLTDY